MRKPTKKKVIIKVSFEYNLSKVCDPDRNVDMTQIVQLYKANIQITIGCGPCEFKLAFCGAELIGVLL